MQNSIQILGQTFDEKTKTFKVFLKENGTNTIIENADKSKNVEKLAKMGIDVIYDGYYFDIPEANKVVLPSSKQLIGKKARISYNDARTQKIGTIAEVQHDGNGYYDIIVTDMVEIPNINYSNSKTSVANENYVGQTCANSRVELVTEEQAEEMINLNEKIEEGLAQKDLEQKEAKEKEEKRFHLQAKEKGERVEMKTWTDIEDAGEGEVYVSYTSYMNPDGTKTTEINSEIEMS